MLAALCWTGVRPVDAAGSRRDECEGAPRAARVGVSGLRRGTWVRVCWEGANCGEGEEGRGWRSLLAGFG